MIKNNFFTLIIINIKDNFPLEEKTLAKKRNISNAGNCYQLLSPNHNGSELL